MVIFSGVPSCQRTVAFEKACILFNLAAIYTQIGARQDRSSEKGLDAAVDNFLRAAGVFKHIYDTFTNAPSMDLKPQVRGFFKLEIVGRFMKYYFFSTGSGSAGGTDVGAGTRVPLRETITTARRNDQC